MCGYLATAQTYLCYGHMDPKILAQSKISLRRHLGGVRLAVSLWCPFKEVLLYVFASTGIRFVSPED